MKGRCLSNWIRTCDRKKKFYSSEFSCKLCYKSAKNCKKIRNVNAFCLKTEVCEKYFIKFR